MKKSLLNALRREFEILQMKNDDTFARVMIISEAMEKICQTRKL